MGGCATTPYGDFTMPMSKAYAEPTQGDRARIRVSTDGALRLAVNTTCSRWDDPASGVGPVHPGGGPLLTKVHNGKTLGMPGAPPPGSTTSEFYVAAGRPVLFHYMKTQQATYTTIAVCNGLFAFVPEAGKDYQAIFMQSADGRICTRGVVDLGNRNATIANLSNQKICGQ